MLWEARHVAQIHVADELTNAVENSTLYSHDKSKKGYSYATFEYQKADGTILVTSLRCVGGGDAQTQIRLWKFFLKFQKVLVTLTAVLFLKNFFY